MPMGAVYRHLLIISAVIGITLVSLWGAAAYAQGTAIGIVKIAENDCLSRAGFGAGRRHVAVASLFLAPGFLPDRAAELALEAGAIAVSAPLGAHPELARVILARYAVGAVELVPV